MSFGAPTAVLRINGFAGMDSLWVIACYLDGPANQSGVAKLRK